MASTKHIRKAGQEIVISPAQVLALANEEALIEIANGVADRYGYERLDDLMEAVDNEN